MKRFEYDIQEFRLTEKWNPKKQQEKLVNLLLISIAKAPKGGNSLG